MGGIGAHKGGAGNNTPHKFGYWDYEDDGWQGEEVQAALKWFQNNSNLTQWEQGLTQDEKQGLYDYARSAYSVINDTLEGKTVNNVDQALVAKEIKDIQSALNKYTLKSPILVTRTDNGQLLGLNSASYQQLKNMEGKTVDVKRFVSTDTSAVSSANYGSVNYTIEVPKGKGMGAWLPTTAGNLSKGEAEFLINSGRKYEIVSVNKGKYGDIDVRVKLK